MEIMGASTLDDVTLSSRLPEVSENVRRLAGAASFPPGVREQAGMVRDLLDLAATWPVPSSINLEEDIRVRLPELCKSSGLALCRMPRCAASGSGDSPARCPAVLS